MQTGRQEEGGEGWRNRTQGGAREDQRGKREGKWDQRKRGWVSGVVRIASGKINVTQ